MAKIQLKVSQSTKDKLSRFDGLLIGLPVYERQQWRNKVAQRLRAAAAKFGGVSVSGGAHEKEWDLEFANWLDNAYGIVSDRVEVVAKKGAGAASALGFSLWPLAAVGVVAYLLLGQRSRAV